MLDLENHLQMDENYIHPKFALIAHTSIHFPLVPHSLLLTHSAQSLVTVLVPVLEELFSLLSHPIGLTTISTLLSLPCWPQII